MASASLSLVLEPASDDGEIFKQPSTFEEAEHYDFISLLGLAQKWDVGFLPITWQPALDRLGEGASAEVFQSTVYSSIALAFKDSSAKVAGKRRVGFRDIMKEVLIVRAPYLRKSPNIIDLLGISWHIDLFEDRVWPVLVYRKGSHGTLRDYICNPKRMEENLSHRLGLCSGVLQGLAMLHSAGVVHGDLKPENIIIQQHDRYLYAAISDFGFSSISHCDDALIQLPSSPPWTAPEHHANKHPFDKAKQMDVFSWSLILFWVLLHRVELSNLSYHDQMKKLTALKSDHKLIETVRSTIRQFLLSLNLVSDEPKIVEDILYILECCLQHDPQFRPKSALEVMSLGILSTVDVPAFHPQDVQDLSLPMHTSFTVQKSISQLSQADFRVRKFILEELFRRTKHACGDCRELAKREAVVALKVGFGGHCIERLRIDNFTYTATGNDKGPYCEHAIQTIQRITKSFGTIPLLPQLDSEVQNLEDFVEPDLVHEYQRRRELEFAVDFYRREIDNRTAWFGGDHPLVIVFQSILILLYESCGNFFASQEISKAVYLLHDRSLGPDHPSTINAMAQYALQSLNAGQPGLAVELGEEIVSRGANVLNHSDRVFVTAASNLGLAYYYIERYAEAETAFKAALEHHDTLFGDQLEAAKIRFNLSRAIRAQGEARLQEYEQLLLETSNQLEQNLGYLHRNTLPILATRLLSLYADIMPNSDVAGLRKTVLEMTKDFLGEQHPDTLWTIAEYADCLGRSGSRAEAISLLEGVLEALQRVPSDTHIQGLAVMANLAVFYVDNDELDRAEELVLGVLNTLRGKLSQLGPQSNLAHHALGTLMEVYRCRGDTDKAELILLAIWENVKAELGDKTVDKGNLFPTIHNLAVTWMDSGHKIPEASELLMELLEASTKCNGSTHQVTLRIRNEIGEGFRRQQQFSKAEKFHSETLKICQEEYGPLHEITRVVAHNLAMMFHYQHKEQAADMLYEIYVAEAKLLGPNHNDTLLTAGWIAAMHRETGGGPTPDVFPSMDPCKVLPGTDRDTIEANLCRARTNERLGYVDEAIKIAQGAIRSCKRRYGDTDLLTLDAWYWLASFLHTAFEKSGSSSQLERASEIANFLFKELKENHGEQHDDTKAAEQLLGVILREQGSYDEAECHLKHSLLMAELELGENIYSVIDVLKSLLKLYEKQGKEEESRTITNRIANLKKEIRQGQTLYVIPEGRTQ